MRIGPFQIRFRRMTPAAGGGSGGGGIEEAPTDGTKYGRKDGAWVAVNDGIIDGEVDVHADLPVTVGTPALGSVYNVKETTGSWISFFTGGRKFSGLWRRISNDGDLDDWEHENHWPDVFSDDKFAVHDDGDATKRFGLDLGGATTGTKATLASAHTADRTATLPDATGTLALRTDAVTQFGKGAGTSLQVLRVKSDESGLEFATPSSGGTKTYAVFKPNDNQPPASNFATFDTRNSILVLDFDDGATNEEAVFVGMVPEAASLGSGLKVRIYWMATSATSGNCRWGVKFADLSDQDIDGLTFDTAAEAHTATSGTSGIAVVTEITITDIDDIVAGVPFALKVYRDSSDTTNDTMTGDAELVAVEIRSAS